MPAFPLYHYLNHDGYLRRLFHLAWPITLQSLILSSLNLVNSLMIGQLGDEPVAAATLAGQVFFLLNLFLFGINSGAAIFTAQLWGKQDTASVRKVMGVALALGMAVGAGFLAIALTLPESVLNLYTRDENVIAVGARYLRAYGPAFFFVAITLSYSSVLRSIGEVRLPIAVNLGALLLNVGLSYGLIFGRLGLPEMGVEGAAWAATAARGVECVALLAVIYLRRSPAAVSWRDVRAIHLPFIVRVLRPVLPVALNEVLWSLGITSYNAIYGNIGSEAVAAMNITSTLDSLALAGFIGVSHATAIMIGHQIGAGQEDAAQNSGTRSLILAVSGAVLMGGVIWLARGPFISLYQVSAEAAQSAFAVLGVTAVFLWMRMTNMILLIGVLRSGGDTRFALVLDGFIIWILGVPLAWIAAFTLHLPLPWVYFFTLSEEACKFILSLWRFFSRRWVHNLARTVSPAETA